MNVLYGLSFGIVTLTFLSIILGMILDRIKEQIRALEYKQKEMQGDIARQRRDFIDSQNAAELYVQKVNRLIERDSLQRPIVTYKGTPCNGI